MAPHTLLTYLERLQVDDLLRNSRQTLSQEVKLTPVTLLEDGTGFHPGGKSLNLESFLEHFRPEDQPGPLLRHPTAVVVAPAGGGKSTLLQALSWEIAQRAQTDDTAPLPFYLPLRWLGERGEALLVSALWRVGVPVYRHALKELLHETQRPLFFLIDPTPAFAVTGAAGALESLIDELEKEWPRCRWIIALRPETATALPLAWRERFLYLLEPLEAATAMKQLTRNLGEPVGESLKQLVAQVPPLQKLIRRPLVVELLNGIAQQLPDADGKQWVTELIVALLERVGGSELPRAKLLATLQDVAKEEAANGSERKGVRLSRKSLPRLQEAGLLCAATSETHRGEELPVRFADPSLRDLLLWLAAPEASRSSNGLSSIREVGRTAQVRVERAPVALSDNIPGGVAERPLPPPRLLAEWDNATRSHDLTALLEVQQQLNMMQAETLQSMALAHRDAGRVEEATQLIKQALALQPEYPRFIVTLGTTAVLAGRHEEGRRILEETLPKAPLGDGYYYLGRAYDALGWQTEAFEALEQAAALVSPLQAEAAALAAQLAPDHASQRQYWHQALLLQPKRADWHTALGVVYEQAGERDEAKRCYQAALEAHPNEAEALHHLGVLLLEEGDSGQALRHLRRATSLQPEEASWLIDLGRALEQEGDAGAEEAFRQATRLEPRSTKPLTELGAYLRRAARLDEAYPILRQALAINDERVDTLLEMGMVCEGREDIPQALAAYRRAAKLAPDSTLVRGNLGAVHRRLGQRDEARRWLAQALDIDPHFGPAYDELAQLAEDEGDWEEAARLYRTALHEMPENVQVRFRTGVMLLHLERPEEAVPLLESASQQMPERAEIHWHLAEGLRILGRNEEALNAYRAAVRLSPTNAIYYLSLALQADATQRLDEAQRAVDRAIALEGTNAEAYHLAASLAKKRDEPSRALDALQHAIEIAPDDPALYSEMAALHHELGQDEEALTVLHRALEAIGDHTALLMDTAQLQRAQGNLEAAATMLGRALQVEPQHQDARMQRAALFMELGQKAQARQEWETLLNLNPNCGAAHFGVGQLLLSENKRDEALAAFERATTGEQPAAAWLLQYALLAKELERHAEATTALQRLLSLERDAVLPAERAEAHHTLALLSRGKEAFEHINHAITLAPETPGYYITLASMQEQAGQLEQCRESLETAHNLAPQDASILTALALHHETRGNMWDATEYYHAAAQHASEPAPLLCNVARLQRELMRDWKEARTTLEEAIAAQPQYAPAHRDMGAILFEAKQWEASKKALRAAYELDPDDIGTLTLLGEILVAQGHDKEAREVLARAAVLAPDHHRIHYLVGTSAFRTGEPEVALAEWQQACKLAPSNGEYQRALGQALAALNRLTEARHAWERALELHPEDAETHFLLGNNYIRQHDPHRAIAAYRQAVVHDPVRAVYRRSLGESYLSVGHWDSALSALRGARELDDSDPHIHFLMAQSYEAIGRVDQALERAEEAATLAPNNATYTRLLGDLRARQGDWKGAATAYRQAVEQQPKDSTLYLALGRCERQSGALDRAIEWFRKAADLEPHGALAPHLLAQTTAEKLRLSFLAELARAEFDSPVSHEAMLSEALEAAHRACTCEPRNPSFQATIAQLYLMKKDPDAALAALRQVQEPSEQRALFLMLAGLATLQRGEHARARSLLDQAARIDGDDPVIWLGLAVAMEEGQDLAGAVAAAERAVTLASDEPLFHYAHARLMTQAGEHSRARRALEHALQGSPDIPAWHRRLGDLRAQMDDAKGAIAAYEVGLEKLSSKLAAKRKQGGEEAAVRAEEGTVCSARGEEALLRFGRGRSLVKVGDIDEAIAEMERAINLYPSEHEWYADLAPLLLDVGRYEDAQALMRSAISHAPHKPEYPYLLARAQAANDEIEEACEILEISIERWPDYAPSWLLLGQLLAEQNEVETAQEILEHALTLAPDDARSHVAFGDVLRRKGDLEGAASHFDTALALDPDNPDAYVQKGRLLDRAGHLEEAMETYHDALCIDKDHLYAHYFLGRTSLDLGHLDKAADHLAKVIEQAPHRYWAWSALAECCEAIGDHDKAFEYYVKANEVADGRQYYYFQMGRLLKDLKRYHEAIPVLRQAVKVEPQNTEAYKLLAAVSAIAFFGGRS